MSHRKDKRRVAGPSPIAGSQEGFTLIELMIALAIMVAVLGLVLTAFERSGDVGRVQTDVANMQNAMRVSLSELHGDIRLAGRGGLPRDAAIIVEQDAADDAEIAGEDVVAGSDILTLRGAFSTPIFRVNSGDPASFQIVGNTATLVIDSITASAFPQPVDALAQRLDPDDGVVPEPVLLVGAQGDAVFAVVELASMVIEDLTLDIQNQSRDIQRATLTLTIDAGEGTHTQDYLNLSGGVFPPQLTSVAFATVLEEYRIYVRDDFSVPGDDQSPPSPKLSRARMLPNTGLVHPGAAGNARVDIADNIFDMQVALGIDLDGNGRVDETDPDDNPLDPDADEWLWNDAADDESLAWTASSLFLVRLNVLGQTQIADRKFISPAIDSLFNREYGEAAVVTDPALIEARRYRRRALQTTVDLRNL